MYERFDHIAYVVFTPPPATPHLTHTSA